MPRGERHFETGRCYGKKELSVLMPKMTESGLRRVRPWEMDRVITLRTGRGCYYDFTVRRSEYK